MNLHEAEKLANDLLLAVRPYCLRAEVAGSIRRRKPEGIKDVEVVCIPRWDERPGADLFNTPEQQNALWRDWVCGLPNGGGWQTRDGVRWIKPGTSELIDWRPAEDGRYWRGLLPNGTKLDLFLTTPENFGLIYLIRTGAADFSQAVVTHAKRIGMRSFGGELLGRDLRALPTPEEADVFRLLGLEWAEPEQRTGPEALRIAR